MNYSEVNGIRMAEVPVKEFRVLLYDGRKKAMGANRCNGGFFGKYGASNYTLPAGHVVCDFAAESPETLASCRERGYFEGDKFSFDAGKWSYKNEFYGKSVSTLIIRDGVAEVNDVTTLPKGCSYAIAGVPVMRHGEDCKFTAYVTAQGWGSGSLRATWHIFVGLKADRADKVWVMAMKTSTSNMIKTSEAYKRFKALGFCDVIKLDGGGSFYFSAGGKTKYTAENRRVCTIISMSDGNPYPVPTWTLFRGNNILKDGNRWLQWELNARGYPCGIDGKFGAETERQLKAYQAANGLKADGRCGKATRTALQKR